MQKQNNGSQKFIAHCEDIEKVSINSSFIKHSKYTILIGPEGDFTLNEIMLAQSNDYLGITLGQNRLRTETAALEACFEINFLNR